MKREITLVVASLQGGGSERVICQIANYLLKNKWTVNFVTFCNPELIDVYTLDKKIKRYNFYYDNNSKIIHSFLSHYNRIAKLNSFFKNHPNSIILSFNTVINIYSLFATYFLSNKVFISERTDPVSTDKLKYIFKIIRYFIYKKATLIIVQNEYFLKWFSNNIHGRYIVQKNPLRKLTVSKIKREKIILSIGRLSNEKGFDVLINAFAEISHLYKDWKVCIYGDGPDKNKLIKLINSLHLSSQIFIFDRVSNIEFFLSQSSIVVQASRYEGMPNAVIEAMALGNSVIASSKGAEFIINHRLNGLLFTVGDSLELSILIKELIDNEKLRVKLSKNAMKIAFDLSEKNILPRWETMLLN